MLVKGAQSFAYRVYVKDKCGISYHAIRIIKIGNFVNNIWQDKSHVFAYTKNASVEDLQYKHVLDVRSIAIVVTTVI